MSNKGLVILVLMLAVCVVLAVTNPTRQAYGDFLQAKLAEAVEQIGSDIPERERRLLRQLYASQGHQLIETMLQQYTQRQNFGLFSIFESRLLDQRILVVGIAGVFIPIEGVDEMRLKLGQLASQFKNLLPRSSPQP